MNLTKNRKLVKNKQAVSAVVSNMILIAAVITVGLTVFAFSQYQASAYQKQYGQTINEDIQQLKEGVTYEYVVYKSGVVSAYILNSGTINGIQISHVYINNVEYSFSFTNLKVSKTVLDRGEEGRIDIGGVTVSPSGTYYIKIVTGRNSAFAGTT